jgi:hypothetical protein
MDLDRINTLKKSRTITIALPTILFVKKIINTKPNINKRSFKQLKVRFIIYGISTTKSILRKREVVVFSKKNM